MRDPQTILDQAVRGPVPPTWVVHRGKRGRVGGLVRRTGHDPDPILVVTPEGAVEYVDSRKPLVVLDVHHRDGRAASTWRPSSFGDDHQAVGSVLEAFGAHRVLRAGH